MLQVQHLQKYFGPHLILDNVSFVINPGDRVGLVGSNGAGKSTLLHLILGTERADAGQVALASGVTVGYLAQGHAFDPALTVAEAVRSGLPGLDAAWQKLEKLAGQMALPNHPDQNKLLEAYGKAQSQFEALGGYDVEHRIYEVLSALNLAALDVDTPISHLSGGQQSRVGLAQVLLAKPSLLLLDEPTNHLDIETLTWLETFLADFSGAALIVSHDRVFLDHTVSRILALDSVTRQLTEYTGNYSDYAEAKASAQAKQWSAWKADQAEIRRAEADIRNTHAHAQQVETGTIDSSARRYAKKVAKKAKVRERKLEAYLNSDDRVEKPQQSWGLKFEFGRLLRGGQMVITLDEVGHRFEEKPLFEDINLTLKHGERIALLGPNGAEKTTLLRIIAQQLNPTDGQVKIGANVQVGYMPQQQESLDPAMTPLSVLLQAAPMSETEARNFLHFFLFAADEVFVPVGRLSYGERARLLLAKMVAAGANCLVLDEPVNHLDIASRERFEEALEAFPGTILAAAHDRTFIDRFATGVWAVANGRVQPYFSRKDMEVSQRVAVH
ncbi:MAG: ABC-F family ATP-binding cassette domain-containing protein [Chloroflexota bacterium]